MSPLAAFLFYVLLTVPLFYVTPRGIPFHVTPRGNPFHVTPRGIPFHVPSRYPFLMSPLAVEHRVKGSVIPYRHSLRILILVDSLIIDALTALRAEA